MGIALDNFRAAQVHELSLSGMTLHFRVFGEGPAVLLLHGWPLSGITYRHLIEALRPHYRCYVPDLPGAGATPWSPRIEETTHGYTALMRAFVDQLQLERLALIGHDSGGGVARLLAAELGTRVSCLILQNTELPNQVPLLVRALKLGAQAPAVAATLTRLLALPAFRRSPIGFGACFGDRRLIDGEFAQACIAPLAAGMAGHNQMLGHLDLGWTRRLPEAHARIEAPIHLFWGGADGFFPLARARAMHATFVQPGELEVIPKAKLYVHEEAADELASFSVRLLGKAFAGARPPASERRASPQS